MTRRRHPSPTVVARYLHRVADILDDQGANAITKARLLAARGWPTSVTGDGSRSADTTSSTERAVLNPGPWAGIDDQLATDLRLVWYAATQLDTIIGRVLAHASLNDRRPPGSGTCDRCCEDIEPTPANPHNQIKSGLCPTCKTGWYRFRRAYPHATKSDYCRTYDGNAA